MISMMFRDTFGGFTFAAMNAKKYSRDCSCYDQPIFNGVFNAFFPNQVYSFIYETFYHHIVEFKACYVSVGL